MNKSRNHMWDVVENHLHYYFFDLKPVFPSLKRFSIFSFQDRECRFNLVSLVVRFKIKRLRESLSLVSQGSFPFSGSNRDKGVRVQGIPDWFMDIFRILPLIHNIEIRFSGSVALPEELFRVRDIVDRMLGDLQSNDNLSSCIDRNWGFQESFPRLSGSPWVMVTCIWTGKSRWIYSLTGDPFIPIIEHFHKPVE